MSSNVEKLRRLRTRFLLIFWIGIPAVLAIIYFAFFHGAAPPEQPANEAPPAASPTPASTDTPRQ
jgi:hypothetical protein